MIGSQLADRIQPSPNHEPRVDGVGLSFLILHYTGMVSGQAATDWLCNPESRVSCHYLVDDDGSIVQMVGEDRRAWHAGQSSWHGVIDINSASIGIEIQNTGHASGCPLFPFKQMRRVAELCLDIMFRHQLGPHQVLAHSDIAPGRKIDPGEAFDWRYLASMGIGQWVVAPHQKHKIGTAADHTILTLQHDLAALGFDVEATGHFDPRNRIVVEAFQRRYRASKVDGVADAETLDVLRRLLAVMPEVSPS